MHIGFTGTKEGMNSHQQAAVASRLAYLLAEGYTDAHHGDCVGADAQFHDIALSLGYRITIHPPSSPYLRAWKKGAVQLPCKPYLARNHDIVDACNLLLATPKEVDEQIRSGTWATVRYALKRNVVVELMLPKEAP